MNREDKKEISEIKELLHQMVADKYDPDNGWKTARAVFESRTINSLQTVQEKLSDLKVSTDKIPDLINTVNDIQNWRKKANTVFKWFGTAFVAPIILFIIYQYFRD